MRQGEGVQTIVGRGSNVWKSMSRQSTDDINNLSTWYNCKYIIQKSDWHTNGPGSVRIEQPVHVFAADNVSRS